MRTPAVNHTKRNFIRKLFEANEPAEVFFGGVFSWPRVMDNSKQFEDIRQD